MTTSRPLASRIPDLVQKRTENLGAPGKKWLGSLDARVADLCNRWECTVGDVLSGGSESLILCAERSDGTEAIMKLGLPTVCDCANEAHVLRLAKSPGYVGLYEQADDHNALLLERLGERLAQSGFSDTRQMEILATNMVKGWVRLPADHGLMAGDEKLEWLKDFINEHWSDFDGQCTKATRDTAFDFIEERKSAHNSAAEAGALFLIHADVHSNNALRGGTSKVDYKFIDPDGILAEPACDLATLMRDFNNDLDESPVKKGLERCAILSKLTNVPERAIWQWGFIERVTTGMVMCQIGLTEEGRKTLTIANEWSGAGQRL